MRSKLIGAIILSAALVFALASCKDGAKTDIGTNTQSSAVTSPSAEGDTSTTDTEILGIPENVRFDGETFNMYIALSTMRHSYDVGGETGELIPDAIFKRNELTKERLGIDLNFVTTSLGTSGGDQMQETQKISSLILAGDTTYDAFGHTQHSGMPGLITEGMFLDWNELPHLDMTKPWWYSNALRDISFGDKIFAMTGDYNIDTLSMTGLYAFNKDIMDELEMPYPYEYVFDGTWTHDKLLEYITASRKDLNGDGLIKWEDDRMGFIAWGWGTAQQIYVGYGGETLTKDERNLPKLNIYSEAQNNVIDRLIELFGYEGFENIYDTNTPNADKEVFKAGRSLFVGGTFTNVVAMRNYDFEFGFVPAPKLTDSQPDYRCRTSNVSGLTYIPVTLDESRHALTGATLEALAYYSYKEVTPVFFETVLAVQSTRDLESEKMIGIIKDSARFMDQSIGFDPNMFAQSGENTLASHWISTKTSYEEKLKVLIGAYEK